MVISQDPQKSVLDERDRRILAALLAEARLSYRRIAKKVRVSVATVMHRVNRLEKEGIIKRYQAVLDYEKLGFDVSAIIDVRVAKGKLLQVEKRIAANPHVAAVYDNTGHFDVTIIARFMSTRSLDSFIKKIQGYEFVERTETKLILNTIKERGIEP